MPSISFDVFSLKTFEAFVKLANSFDQQYFTNDSNVYYHKHKKIERKISNIIDKNNKFSEVYVIYINKAAKKITPQMQLMELEVIRQRLTNEGKTKGSGSFTSKINTTYLTT